MKILCVSDQIDPLVYSVTAKERFSDVDLVLCAGDLPMDYIDFIVSTLNKPTYFVFGNHNLTEFVYYHKKAVGQKGSHPHPIEQPSPFDMSHNFGAIYAGFKSLKEPAITITDSLTNKKRPLLIAGVSGSMRYNEGLNQYTESQMKAALLKLYPSLMLNKLRYGCYLDIFLTHASPRHIHDLEDPCHKGFECFKWFMKKFKPAYLIHGHIHLYDIQTPRVTKFEQTTVINAYSHYLLDFSGGNNNG